MWLSEFWHKLFGKITPYGRAIEAYKIPVMASNSILTDTEQDGHLRNILPNKGTHS